MGSVFTAGEMGTVYNTQPVDRPILSQRMMRTMERSELVKGLGLTPVWLDGAWQLMKAGMRWTTTLQSAGQVGGGAWISNLFFCRAVMGVEGVDLLTLLCLAESLYVLIGCAGRHLSMVPQVSKVKTS